MVRRATRFFNLLDRFEYDHEDRDQRRFGIVQYNKTVPKEVLVKLADRVGEGDVSDMTVPQVREFLRDAGHTRARNKSGETKFSTDELLDLSRAVEHAEYLEADDIADPEKTFSVGDWLVINGERYKVLRSWWNDEVEAEWESYTVVTLAGEPERRLVLLHGYEPSYRTSHSAVLEKRGKAAPYHGWKKDEYIETFEVEET